MGAAAAVVALPVTVTDTPLPVTTELLQGLPPTPAHVMAAGDDVPLKQQMRGLFKQYILPCLSLVNVCTEMLKPKPSTNPYPPLEQLPF